MSSSRPAMRVPVDTDKPRRFVFVLMDQFSLLCFATAIESLRIANRMAGKTLYQWNTIGEGGESISCSAGTVFSWTVI